MQELHRRSLTINFDVLVPSNAYRLVQLPTVAACSTAWCDLRQQTARRLHVRPAGPSFVQTLQRPPPKPKRSGLAVEPKRTGPQTTGTGVRLHLVRLGRRHPRLGKQPRAGRRRQWQNRPLPLRTRHLRPRGPGPAPPTDAPVGPAELYRRLRHRPRPAVDPHPASATD